MDRIKEVQEGKKTLKKFGALAMTVLIILMVRTSLVLGVLSTYYDQEELNISVWWFTAFVNEGLLDVLPSIHSSPCFL